ncbi:protein-disulfide reductase DsbD family protein [Thermoflavifilum thermophilum]|uniref:Thiol:disulfide interchange protein DsbD n=1 Tax=Thermoflavifilum thermophilum TaxID=1393122 RepID=A0A1I7N4L8_9BACT|nr:thioredoxin family protein [Thermoflavifilum thermophilum]SFV29607.1 thiol:disulfide interchange protein DsbD [Thermoflavifilum thermophilum]
MMHKKMNASYGWILAFLLCFTGVHAQLLNPVRWNFSTQKINDSTYELHFRASIDPGWHIYAQDAGEGPIPTSFHFQQLQGWRLVGPVQEHGKKISHFDGAFGTVLKYFEREVDFVQTVKQAGPGSGKIEGSLEYMVCNDKNCLPPKEVPFSFQLIGHASRQIASPAGADSGLMNLPSGQADAHQVSKTDNQEPNPVVAVSQSDEAPGKSLWWIFWASLGGGFLALITPCVFSMIPLTVSFFIKRSASRSKAIRHAAVYSLSIIVIYTGLGFIITRLLGVGALNTLASNIWVNLIFFVLFVLFALSFLGAFEIRLPGALATQTDARAGIGNLAGIFFMALTLAIVSFSCTAPIIGNLLVLAVHGGVSGPLVGMFGFSLALAIPFSVFAIFPQWLQKVARPGGWLNAVKVTLGFVELALAFKFLSNVDMAYHWNILNKEVFLAIWIVIFGLTGLYLLGKLRLAGDAPPQALSIPRLFFAMMFLAFTIYLIPGLFGAELRGIVSGFLPNYSGMYFPSQAQYVATGPSLASAQPRKYADIFAKSTPPGYTAYYDYDEALQVAREQHKPVMVDFTGWSCVNCRKMENAVWTDPAVRQMINQHFILLSLYVDDRTPLPDSLQYISRVDGTKIKTLGQKNADFEAARFNRNAQPYYVILDPQGNLLSDQGYGYDPDPAHFLQFLQKALDKFHQRTAS